MVNKCTRKYLGNNWTELTCGKYKVQIKHFQEKSEHGINKGKISKFWMKDTKANKEIINFDRGWDRRVTPKTPRDAKAVYNKIIKEFN
jgi:hypothetical protein